MFTKKELRKRYKQLRKELSAEKVFQESKKIHDWLFSRIMMHRFVEIHIFLPIQKENEIDTFLIINTLRKDFAPTIYISKVEEMGNLSHYAFLADTQLIANKWGILEPLDTSMPIPETTFDLVFIPLLCFDKSGYRVGYGGGYYDRFLAKCSPNCLKIGLSLFDPVEKIEDVNEFDIRMDYCVTPTKIWSWKN